MGVEPEGFSINDYIGWVGLNFNLIGKEGGGSNIIQLGEGGHEKFDWKGRGGKGFRPTHWI